MRNALLAGLAVVGLALATPPAAEAFPIAAAGSEGFNIVVATDGEVFARYEGTSASYTDMLWLEGPTVIADIFNNQATPVGTEVSLGSFAAGTVLRFSIHVINTGNIFYTGPGELNADGVAHARVQANWEPGRSLVSFEDLLNGPFDYNDLSFSFTNTIGVDSTAVPEPLGLSLLGLGLLGLGAARRKRG
ncbi:PEP-CTERM sorting domain-containing protein [Siccirubricoccus phaeus]|uniref:PEP-CTERM sorting domain-containing protein n=1 Tax=Siccirubricoccus phaeus TaxID=2595053 RepID=UPI001A9C86C0|nr:PEP-CTERM sorting domain-containing protein [Siccirubricoccus phaeus]